MIYLNLLLLLFFPFTLVAQQLKTTITTKVIKENALNEVAPYLLPEGHEIKPFLDELFSKNRATLSLKTLKKAGFIDPKPMKWTHLIFTRHRDLPGYVFKIYLDTQRYFSQKPEYIHWIDRINGKLLIEEKITQNGWDQLFKVPGKWIYKLPDNPAPPKEFIRKDFILVEEDMDIYDTEENNQLWGSDFVTEEKLIAFYTLLEEVGLHDCAKPANAPFSKDGKVAFIDTESYHHWPVLYEKMTPFLSEKNRVLWKNLTKK